MSDLSLLPTPGYQRGIQRLQDFLLERELSSEFPDEDILERFHAALERGLDILTFAPHTCRRCESAPGWRELLLPFGGTGFVVLFDIHHHTVLLLAIRGQREEDYR